MDKYNYRAYEILEFKAKILRMSVAVAGGFVALILVLGLLGVLK
jgi:hypothetical protein